LKEDQDSDKRAAEIFMQSITVGDPETMTQENKIDVLRGTCAFLLKELQKTYMYIERHSNGHDSFLHKDLAQSMSYAEDLLTMFFPDFLKLEEDEEKENEDGDGNGD
jgi:hypothetical protein